MFSFNFLDNIPEEVCDIAQYVEEDGGDDDGQDDAEQSSAKGDLNLNQLISLDLCYKHSVVHNGVLGQLHGSKVAQIRCF